MESGQLIAVQHRPGMQRQTLATPVSDIRKKCPDWTTSRHPNTLFFTNFPAFTDFKPLFSDT